MLTFHAYHSSSAGNLYQVTAPNRRPLLLECGVPIAEIKRSLGFRLTAHCGCLVTHAHQDHARSVRDILAAGIDIYCSESTVRSILAAGPLDTHRLHIIAPMRQIQIDGWTIIPFEVVHDVDCLGYLITDGSRDRLLFAVDTAYIPQRFAPGLTHIAIETNYSDDLIDPSAPAAVTARLFGNHMELGTAIDFILHQDLYRVREIHLLHLSERNSNAEEFRDRVQRATGIPVFVAPA